MSHADVKPAAVSQHWAGQFARRINDDLDTPGALAALWEMIKDASLSPPELLATLLEMDKVLGLNLAEPDEAARILAARYMQIEASGADLPEDVRTFLAERDEARRAKNWQRADELRTLIEAAGYTVEDKDGATRVLKQ